MTRSRRCCQAAGTESCATRWDACSAPGSPPRRRAPHHHLQPVLSATTRLPPQCPPHSKLKFRVLDECDEMLNMGFVDDVEKILNAGVDAASVQTLLFSATLPHWVRGREAVGCCCCCCRAVGCQASMTRATEPPSFPTLAHSCRSSLPPPAPSPAGQGHHQALPQARLRHSGPGGH